MLSIVTADLVKLHTLNHKPYTLYPIPYTGLVLSIITTDLVKFCALPGLVLVKLCNRIRVRLVKQPDVITHQPVPGLTVFAHRHLVFRVSGLGLAVFAFRHLVFRVSGFRIDTWYLGFRVLGLAVFAERGPCEKD